MELSQISTIREQGYIGRSISAGSRPATGRRWSSRAGASLMLHGWNRGVGAKSSNTVVEGISVCSRRRACLIVQSTCRLVLRSILEVHSQLILIVSCLGNVDHKGSKWFLFASKVQHGCELNRINRIITCGVGVDVLMVAAEGDFLARLMNPTMGHTHFRC